MSRQFKIGDGVIIPGTRRRGNVVFASVLAPYVRIIWFTNVKGENIRPFRTRENPATLEAHPEYDMKVKKSSKIS